MIKTLGGTVPAAGPLAATKLCVRCDARADYDAWTAWTGRAPDLVHAFGNAGGSGGSFANPVAPWDNCLALVRTLCSTWAGVPLAWALPLCTNSQPLTDTTAGTYNGVINAMADAILAHNPAGPIFVRIGWEAFTPAAWPWAATTAAGPTDYVAAFRAMAAVLKARSPRFKIVWCVSSYNFDAGNIEFDPTTAYPGDAFVDVVGVDAYLIGADVSKAVTFARASQGKDLVGAAGFRFGLKYMADFARAHSKMMSIDEWGIGADRPDYIRDMAQFIADPANRVAYHGYWNKNAGAAAPGPYPFPCRLTPDGGNNYPLSQAAFLDAMNGTGRAYVEQPETPAFFARATSAPTATRRASVDTLVSTLRRFGLLSTVDGTPALDGLFLFAAADSEIARLGLNLPGGFTTTVPTATGKATISGSVGFLADRGFQGDGAAAFLNLNINPTNTLPAGRFAQDSGHMGTWFLTANTPAAQQFECGNANSAIGMNNAGAFVGRPNQASTITLVNSGSGPGHVLWNRTGAAAWASFFNGAAARSGADASAALTNANFNACGVNGVSFGSQRLALMHWGRALLTTGNQNEPAQIYAALLAYLQAVGAV
ncbi:hypothetical protein H0176_23525 [Methylorubrum populi]|uniref:glycosyl hydrolase n=1 Tax=Methylorubrum rhodesianum TaxID=29427 RepID=UPI00190DE8E7|nr:glycosyl hydrolase [Methylorubrum rhodesianum]MBK3406291.1 hypothetical protein [Methylorubrum rhodesianum]MBY0143215.1 hypothetical protein [Methylorubrum populi]